MNRCFFIFNIFALMLTHIAYGSDAPKLNWAQLPDRPVAVGGQYAGTSNGVLLAAGGAHFPTPLFEGGKKVWIDSIFALKPGATEWTKAGRLPRPLAYGGSVSDESGFFLIGGGDAEQHYADVTRILWKDGKLTQETLPPLPQPCAFHSAIKVGDAIYSLGGQAAPSSSSALHVFWRLDLQHPDQGWKALKAWPGPARILPVLASHGGDVFLFGGSELYKGDDGSTQRRYLTDAYRYNEKSDWEQLPNLPRPVTAAPSPAYVLQNQIFIFSGDNGEFADRVWELKDKHPGFNRDCVILDLDSSTWTQSGTLPFSLATTPSVTWQNSYIIPGGEDRPGHRIPTVYKLNHLGSSMN